MGRSYPGRIKNVRLNEDGPIIDGGLTRNAYEKRTAAENERVKLIAPWIKPKESLSYREGICALYLGLSDNINGKHTKGWSNYHITEAGNVRYATQRQATFWGIENEDPFVEMDECVSGIHSDDGDMDKWPIGYQNINLTKLSIKMYKNSLNHSQYASVLLLCSAESSKDSDVRYYVLKQCEDLSNLDRISVWNVEESCWMCMKHTFYGCHDWPMECTLYGLLGHSSRYYLHMAMLIREGEIKPIDGFDNKQLLQIFIDGIPRENYQIDLDEWQENKKSGTCLTTTEMIQYQWDKLSPVLTTTIQNAMRRNTYDKWNNHSYHIQQLSKLAINQEINLNRDPLTQWVYNVITEMMHAYHTYMKYQTKGTVYYMNGSCLFTKSQSFQAIDRIS